MKSSAGMTTGTAAAYQKKPREEVFEYGKIKSII